MLTDDLIANNIIYKYGSFFYKELQSYFYECDYTNISDEDRKIGENNQYSSVFNMVTVFKVVTLFF